MSYLPSYINNVDSSNDSYIVTQNIYDAAGRLKQTVDNVGRVNETLYDAAGRTVITIQNYRTDGLVNPSNDILATDSDSDVAGKIKQDSTDKDITVKYDYDAKGRLASMVAYNAIASGTAVQTQTTSYGYDDSSTSINASWQTSVTYPDTHQTTKHYDRLGRVKDMTDQRGVVHQYVYDAAGRLWKDEATTIPSDIDNSIQSIVTTYDDVGRVQTVSSCQDSSGTSVFNQVKYWYDGWGNVEYEWQEHNGAVVDSDFNTGSVNIAYEYGDGSDSSVPDGVNKVAAYDRLILVWYPATPLNPFNHTMLQCLYGDTNSLDDMLSRLSGFNTNGAQASYSYLGASTIATEDLGDIQIKLDYSATSSLSMAANFGTWDRFGRVQEQLWSSYGDFWSYWGDTSQPDDFQYTYDREGNAMTRINELNPALDETYNYDAMNRLSSMTRAAPRFSRGASTPWATCRASRRPAARRRRARRPTPTKSRTSPAAGLRPLMTLPAT